MTEEYILWHDWHWVNQRVEFISQYRREERRWDLMSRLAAASAPQATEGMQYWQSLFEATITEAERAAQREAEEREAQRMLQEQRRARREARQSGRRIRSI